MQAEQIQALQLRLAEVEAARSRTNAQAATAVNIAKRFQRRVDSNDASQSNDVEVVCDGSAPISGSGIDVVERALAADSVAAEAARAAIRQRAAGIKEKQRSHEDHMKRLDQENGNGTTIKRVSRTSASMLIEHEPSRVQPCTQVCTDARGTPRSGDATRHRRFETKIPHEPPLTPLALIAATPRSPRHRPSSSRRTPSSATITTRPLPSSRALTASTWTKAGAESDVGLAPTKSILLIPAKTRAESVVAAKTPNSSSPLTCLQILRSTLPGELVLRTARSTSMKSTSAITRSLDSSTDVEKTDLQAGSHSQKRKRKPYCTGGKSWAKNGGKRSFLLLTAQVFPPRGSANRGMLRRKRRRIAMRRRLSILDMARTRRRTWKGAMDRQRYRAPSVTAHPYLHI